MKEIYQDGTYLRHNPTWHVEDSGWKAKKIWELLERNGVKPETVGEVGCGAGEILCELAKDYLQESRLYGYEITKEPLAGRKVDDTGRVSFEVRDILEDDSIHFELLMAIDVIEHVEDYFGFLRKSRGKANRYVFHIPLQMNCLQVMLPNKLIGSRLRLGHLHYFTKETAIETLKDTGYEIIDYFYTTKSFDQSGSRGIKGDLVRSLRKLAFRWNANWCVKLFGGAALMVLAK